MRTLFATLLILSGIACGGADLPDISTSGMEPAVADSIRSALDRTREDRNDPTRWLHLAMVLHAHRLPSPAAVAYAEAARLDQGDHRAPHLEGRMVEFGDPERALRLAEEALRRNSGFAPSLALRARLLEALGEDPASAWEALRSAAPRSLEAGLAQGRRLLAAGENESARDAFQALLETHPASTAGWSFLAQALAALPDPEAAAEAARRARLATGPASDPDPLLLAVEDLRRDRRGREARARRATASGNDASAEIIYRRLVDEDPENANLRYNHANALARLGRTDEAEAGYRAALSRDPDSSPALANLANLLARTGRDAEADSFYRRSAAADPGHLPTLLGASSLHFQRGDLREAEQLLRQALDRNPDHPAALQGLGQLLATDGRFPEAASALNRALMAAEREGAPPRSRAGIHFLLADVERSRERRAEALRHLAEAEALGMEVPPGFREQLER